MDHKYVSGLPSYTDATSSASPVRPWMHRRRKRRTFRLLAAACLTYLAYSTYRIATNTTRPAYLLSIERLQEDYAACAALRNKPVNPSGARDFNKRWVNGTKPTLIRNATIWTGEPAKGTSPEDARAGKGWAWVNSDVFLDRGLIVKIAPNIASSDLPDDTEIVDVEGSQLTSGIVDMHSHAGEASVGNLQDDVNEMSNDVTPYVRSIDSIDPLHPEFEYIKSGGVTTSLFLPGSGNNIGGEAFVLKFAVGPKSGRSEISQANLIADPDKNWRYMKMACGENPKRVYAKRGEHGPFSRMGEGWAFRHAFEQATSYVRDQNDWCAAADRIGVENMKSYLRQELEWEALGAVLRGQVRVNTHCYTLPDLEAFVRHTNEFKFRLYAFHHAHQTFLIPEVLKRVWGGTPAVALFADNMYYKVEAYRASEHTGAILYAQNITPTYVSDNPVLNSQHVVFEAAKAHGYGLPYHAALAGVTSAPAELLGLGERIGKVKEGFDADVVVWDSDPLSVGAAPVQVWIDGAKQFKDPVVLKKPVQQPITSDLSTTEDSESKEVKGDLIIQGISHVYHSEFSNALHDSQSITAIVSNGRLACVGHCTTELEEVSASRRQYRTISLDNGYLTPPFTAFGTALGLAEIDAERATHDGQPPSEGVSRAVDGLLFGGKQLAATPKRGVTKAISAPYIRGIDAKGVSVGFLTGAKNKLEEDAVWQEEVGLHYVLTLRAKSDKTPSISSVIGALRAKLLDAVNSLDETTVLAKEQYEEKAYLKRVVKGDFPLVLSVHSADTIASIISLKSQIEGLSSTKLRIVIIGGAEAHLVAVELAKANISLVLAPLLPHQQSWDQKRSLTGPPLTNSSFNILLDAGVQLGISTDEPWETRDLGLLAGIAYANSEGRLTFKEALGLVGGNIHKVLGIEHVKGKDASDDWVIWEGSPLGIGGQVRAIGDRESAYVWE